MKKNLRWILLALVMVPLACDKNDPTPAGPNEHVNSWIFENMEYWYFWSDNMPLAPNKSLEPEPFFESLINSQDRFSWIQENYTELLNSLRGVSKEAGFEFGLYRQSADNNSIIMQVFYIKPASPAEAAGLKRGDVVTHINSTSLTVDNYQSLLGQMSDSHSLTYTALDINSKTFGSAKTITLVPVEYAEDPNFLNKVFTYGDRKIGYYVYNLFSEGPAANDKTYTTKMDAIFTGFKSSGITDLIIDLRFNSGGAETASQNLASLIAKNVTSTTVFAKHLYNEKVTEDIINTPTLGEGFLSAPFLIKSQNVGSQLRESRVYILTGTRTASASELIINSLKPFMDVFLIGSTTVGKNVGSISLYDDKDPENTWGIQPIVTKMLNASNQSDYSNGFNPQIMDADNSLFLYPLGDVRETLLNRALKQITGLETIARTDAGPRQGELLFHSLDSKRRSGILTIEPPL